MVLERTSGVTATKDLHLDSQALTIEAQGDTLFVGGDIDLYVASDFRQAGEKHVVANANPLIDLLAVPFLDSAGLAALLSIVRIARVHEHPLRVKAVGNPRRVLRITGIDRMLAVED
ncbi:MAG: STAS domain-containing protein [Akkermansiaceae bacterium]|nr:STAS domain-containing protein [Armatimonadota bacterium]